MIKFTVFFACLLAMSSASSIAVTGAIEVHGHRGARALFPENTLPAFQHAIEVGADFLELDLGVTKNRRLVVSHERHIDPNFFGLYGENDWEKIPTEPLIHTLSLAEVQRFGCGFLPHPRFPKQARMPGTRMPTLKEVFQLVADSPNPHARTIGFNIETKINPNFPNDTVGPQEFAELVVKEFREFRQGMFWKRIVLQSFDPRTLKEAQAIVVRDKLAPGLTLSFLVEYDSLDSKNPREYMLKEFESDADRLKPAEDRILAVAEHIGAAIISPEYEHKDGADAAHNLTTQGLVERAHAAGRRVIAWTANKKEEWDDLVVDKKVDGIISDDPAALLKYLGR